MPREIKERRLSPRHSLRRFRSMGIKEKEKKKFQKLPERQKVSYKGSGMALHFSIATLHIGDKGYTAKPSIKCHCTKIQC